MAEGYDRNKDVQIVKYFSKTDKRYLNVIVYSYDGGTPKIRIAPVSKNTNPNAASNKQWINGKSISGMELEEAELLLDALEKAVVKLRKELK